MSTQQVDRLQALLQRVKQNRAAPRSSHANSNSGASSNAKAAPAPAAARPAAPAAAAPQAPPAQPPAARKPVPQGPTTPVGMPTPARVATAPVAALDDELDFSSLPPPGASRAPQEPAFTPAERRTRPGATPLEMAVEDTLDRPAVAPVVQLPTRAAQPAAPPAPVAQAQPATAARRDGVVLADPVPATPARPIAQVLSKHAPITPTSFGDLLKRSLSLRPR